MSIYLGSELLGGTSTNTVSNAHSLLDYKWTDHKLNEMAWLRADTWSWQSGKVYEAAYNHLIADLSSAELKTETFNDIIITYYVAKDGHKIAYESEITRVSNIFESLGTAWWYIIDIPNKRFKLPRSTHGDIVENYQNGSSWYRLYADGWCEQGGTLNSVLQDNYTAATITFLKPFKDTSYYVNLIEWHNGQQLGMSQATGGEAIHTKTANSCVITCYSWTYGRMWEAKGKVASNVSAESPSQYLYFYVGDYSQSAIEQTAGITSEELANKIDLPNNVTQSSCDFVIDYKAPTSADPTWYRLYKSGWVEQGGYDYVASPARHHYNTVYFPITMSDLNYTVTISPRRVSGNYQMCIGTTNATTTSCVISCYGIAESDRSEYLYWKVEGFAAQ